MIRFTVPGASFRLVTEESWVKLRIACHVAMPWPMLTATSPVHRLPPFVYFVGAVHCPAAVFPPGHVYCPTAANARRPLQLPSQPYAQSDSATASRNPSTSSLALRRRSAADSMSTALATVATSRGVRSTVATISATAASSMPAGLTDSPGRLRPPARPRSQRREQRTPAPASSPSVHRAERYCPPNGTATTARRPRLFAGHTPRRRRGQHRSRAR